MRPADDLVALLLATQGPHPECSDLGDWLPIWHAAQSTRAASGSFAAAVACALKADRVAWAFFSGYQGAIQAAFHTETGTVGAFGANEAQRKITEIETSLDDRDGRLLLTGSKSWVLAGIDDLTLFVLARRASGPAKGPGSLSIVRLPIRSAGVEAEPRRTQAVVPELPHSAVHFESTPLTPSDVLQGDGYADYAKPFRLREDVFVTGCVLAYLLAESQLGSWPTTWSQRTIAVLSLLETCSRRDPRQADTIILVAGALSFAGDVIRDAEPLWTPSQELTRARWLRDRPILALGKEARRQRAIQSWKAQERDTDDRA
jgi:acyl-CoA dehydrogenase